MKGITVLGLLIVPLMYGAVVGAITLIVYHHNWQLFDQLLIPARNAANVEAVQAALSQYKRNMEAAKHTHGYLSLVSRNDESSLVARYEAVGQALKECARLSGEPKCNPESIEDARRLARGIRPISLRLTWVQLHWLFWLGIFRLEIPFLISAMMLLKDPGFP